MPTAKWIRGPGYLAMAAVLAAAIPSASFAIPVGNGQAAYAMADDPASGEESGKKKKKKKKNRNVAGCVIGGILGVGLGLLTGQKAGTVIGLGAAGCAAGFALAALTKKDNEALDTYVSDDYALSSDSSGTFLAPESGKTVTLTTTGTSEERVEHRIGVSDQVVLDPANFIAEEKVRYATRSLRLRGSMDTSTNNNILGGYNARDKLHTYGTSLDGAWTYVVAKQADGTYEVIGYVASNFLSDRAPAPEIRRAAYTAPRPTGKGRQTVTPATSGSRPLNVQTVVATTRCKNISAAVEGQSTSRKSCGGGANLAFLSPAPNQKRKAHV